MKVEYIGEKETIAFERGKAYPVLSIERGWYRVSTELEDDYLFRPCLFRIVDGSEADVPRLYDDIRPIPKERVKRGQI